MLYAGHRTLGLGGWCGKLSSHMTVGCELIDLEELRQSPPQSGLSVWLMSSLHQMLERLSVPKYSPLVNKPRTCDSETVGMLRELDPK